MASTEFKVQKEDMKHVVEIAQAINEARLKDDMKKHAVKLMDHIEFMRLKQRPVKSLCLPFYVHAALYYNKYEYVQQLMETGWGKLLSVKNIGPKAAEYIVKGLREIGIKKRMPTKNQLGDRKRN